MSFVSYGFLVFMAVCLLCFLAVNAVPGNKKSRRAAVLFAASAVFLWLSGGILSLAVYGCSALTVWAGARGIERAGQQKGDSPKASAGKKRIFLAVLLCNLALLAAFKYVNFPGYTLRELAWLTGREEMVSWTPVSIPAPAAISFYTLTLLGYLIEVYWGVERAEKRFWKPWLKQAKNIWTVTLKAGSLQRMRSLTRCVRMSMKVLLFRCSAVPAQRNMVWRV